MKKAPLWLAILFCAACADDSGMQNATDEDVRSDLATDMGSAPDIGTHDGPTDLPLEIDTNDTGAMDGGNPGDAPSDLSDTDVEDSTPDMDEPSPVTLTWVECRRAFLNQILTPGELAHCDANHRAPPSRHVFGTHWIFLGTDPAIVDTYPESQLGDLNQIFSESQMEFFVASREHIASPVAPEGGGGQIQHSIRELIPDLKQYLDTELNDPQAVLDLFIARMVEVGVELGPGIGQLDINLETRWTSTQLHQHIGRLYHDRILIVVRDAQGEKSTGSYPRRNYNAPTVGLIYLSVPTPLSALPHEMGHFFGLLHTHGTWPRQTGSTQSWQSSTLHRISEDDWQNLRDVAGADYSSDFRDLFLPYDCDEQEIFALESAQNLGRIVLGWSDFTYTGSFEPVPTDAQFISLVLDRQPPLMKNFVRTNEGGSFSGNNCTKSYVGEDRRTLRCYYGDNGQEPVHALTAADGVVRDTLLFGDSTESNLMSYINTYIDDGERRKKHLTPRQRDLIRFGSRVPTRLRLRNHADD